MGQEMGLPRIGPTRTSRPERFVPDSVGWPAMDPDAFLPPIEDRALDDAVEMNRRLKAMLREMEAGGGPPPPSLGPDRPALARRMRRPA